ncbi:MAG: methylmalonate-semialdehyde dehydrogenase (CoA acylating), partial [Actinobacteria bacterium HGW-Actinobacteria-8]
MTTTIPHWLDGKPFIGDGDTRSPVHNPATGEVIAELVRATPQEVERIISSSATAFETWSQVSLSKRSGILFRFRELLVEHTDELAAIITREHGKVISDAKGEIARGLEVVEFACGIPQLLKGEFSEQAATGIDVYSFRQPVGVVAGITPFNFPVMIPLWMNPVAIATGNTFILKPPDRDPGAAMFLAELWRKAGLPDGVFSVVHGDPDVIGRLLTHPDVAAVSFVGSTPTAKHIHETATKHGKRCQALGAAKNHGIVLADADLENAANNLIAAAFGAAGERCMALPVVAVQEEVADELVAMLVERANAVRVLPGEHPDSDMGPVITEQAKARITALIDSAQSEGAEILV